MYPEEIQKINIMLLDGDIYDLRGTARTWYNLLAGKP